MDRSLVKKLYELATNDDSGDKKLDEEKIKKIISENLNKENYKKLGWTDWGWNNWGWPSMGSIDTLINYILNVASSNNNNNSRGEDPYLIELFDIPTLYDTIKNNDLTRNTAPLLESLIAAPIRAIMDSNLISSKKAMNNFKELFFMRIKVKREIAIIAKPDYEVMNIDTNVYFDENPIDIPQSLNDMYLKDLTDLLGPGPVLDNKIDDTTGPMLGSRKLGSEPIRIPDSYYYIHVPRILDLKLEIIGSDGEPEFITLMIPYLTLFNHNLLGIDKASVDFSLNVEEYYTNGINNELVESDERTFERNSRNGSDKLDTFVGQYVNSASNVNGNVNVNINFATVDEAAGVVSLKRLFTQSLPDATMYNYSLIKKGVQKSEQPTDDTTEEETTEESTEETSTTTS